MSVHITDVVALTGTPGLHQIIKRDDKSIVIESIDDRKKRQVVRGTMMLSKLSDITMYTDDDTDEDADLATIFRAIQEKYKDTLPVAKKSSKDELFDFLKSVLPNFDQERVYPSNIKKLISWYKITQENGIDLTEKEEEPEEKAPEEEAPKEKEAKKPKKEAAKKATKSSKKKA